MINIRTLLYDNISIQEKCDILMKSIELIEKMMKDESYSTLISEIMPDIEKNLDVFDEKGEFCEDLLIPYINKYEIFQRECMKYQVYLVGNASDCSEIKNYMNNEKVHLLARADGDVIPDYIIVCTMPNEELTQFLANTGKNTHIVNLYFVRYVKWQISPETAYYDMKLKKNMKTGVEGALCGMSYEANGVDCEKIENLACLAAPSMDLFCDYYSFLWLYEAMLIKQKTQIKYCLIGMNYYKLWFDLSLSSRRSVMLSHYEKLGDMHHCHDFDGLLSSYKKDVITCNMLMDDYVEQDFNNHFPQKPYEENLKKSFSPDTHYKESVEHIKKLFDKPYPETFKENVAILDKFLKFCYIHNITVLVFIPPFSKLCNEFTPAHMRQQTQDIIMMMQEKYGFEFLDFNEREEFEDKHFRDADHLNMQGRDLLTKCLMPYIDKMR